MKKNLFFAAIAAMVITSCTTTIKTATTTELPADLLSATVADLDVSSTRISYTMTPSKEVARAGLGNAKRAAQDAEEREKGDRALEAGAVGEDPLPVVEDLPKGPVLPLGDQDLQRFRFYLVR